MEKYIMASKDLQQQMETLYTFDPKIIHEITGLWKLKLKFISDLVSKWNCFVINLMK